MAGSFGFEPNHFDISNQVGELVLLPAVRNASADTLIVADGFSCREQIEQGTARRAVHIAHTLRMAMSGARPSNEGAIEQTVLPPRVHQPISRELAAAALIGIGATMGLLAARRGWWKA